MCLIKKTTHSCGHIDLITLSCGNVNPLDWSICINNTGSGSPPKPKVFDLTDTITQDDCSKCRNGRERRQREEREPEDKNRESKSQQNNGKDGTAFASASASAR